jgi:hypothetical protein
VLLGRGTYSPGLTADLNSPYTHLRQIPLSRSLTTSPDPAVELTTEAPVTLIAGSSRRTGSVSRSAVAPTWPANSCPRSTS